MLQLRNFLKDVLPPSALEWLRKSSIRRWVLTARYLRYVSYEIQARSTRLESGQLEDLEARLIGPQGGLYRQIIEEVIERSDLLLKQLDRKLEGQGARQGERLRELEDELKSLRDAVDRLTEATRGGVSAQRPTTNPPQENPLPRTVGRTSAASE